MTVRVIFIRHGQTAWNAAGRYQGRTDTKVSAEGVADSHRLARRLSGVGIEALVSSPLRRALATVDILAPSLGPVPCSVDPRLTEIAFGDWEGMTQVEVKTESPESLREWKRNPATFRFPGGESLADAHERLRDFLRVPPWRGDAEPRCVAVVTHAGLIRLATLEAERRPLADYRRIEVAYADVREFFCERDGRLRPNNRSTLDQPL